MCVCVCVYTYIFRHLHIFTHTHIHTHTQTQVHMDNSFDGVNRRLLTTIYYLNPSWEREHGGRFIPWPCSDKEAAEGARHFVFLFIFVIHFAIHFYTC